MTDLSVKLESAKSTDSTGTSPVPAAPTQTPWTDALYESSASEDGVEIMYSEHQYDMLAILCRRLEALCHQQQEALIADNYDAVAKKTKFQKEQAALAAYAQLAKEMERG